MAFPFLAGCPPGVQLTAGRRTQGEEDRQQSFQSTNTTSGRGSITRQIFELLSSQLNKEQRLNQAWMMYEASDTEHH